MCLALRGGLNTWEAPIPPHAPPSWRSMFGASHDLLFQWPPTRAPTEGSQLSSQELSGRELGSAILLSQQALLWHRDPTGRRLSLLAKWLWAHWWENRGIQAKRRSRRSAASRAVAATVPSRFMGRAHSQQISRPIYPRQRLRLKGSTINPGVGVSKQQANLPLLGEHHSSQGPAALHTAGTGACMERNLWFCIGSISHPRRGAFPSVLAETTAFFPPSPEAGSLILPLDQDLSHFLECRWAACLLQLLHPPRPWLLWRGRREGQGTKEGGKPQQEVASRAAGSESQTPFRRLLVPRFSHLYDGSPFTFSTNVSTFVPMLH